MTRPFHNFQSIVQQLRDVIAKGLVGGLGNRKPGQMCVEAAVCYVLGLKHGDNPASCVGAVDRAFAINLNDAWWSSVQARAEGLVEFAIAHLGSVTVTEEQRCAWTSYIVEQTIRRIVPMALRAAASLLEDPHRQNLLDAAERCEKEGTAESAKYAVAKVVKAMENHGDYSFALSMAKTTAEWMCSGSMPSSYEYYLSAARAADAAALTVAIDPVDLDKPLQEMARIAVEAYRKVNEQGPDR